jgi:hypothetical protein
MKDRGSNPGRGKKTATEQKTVIQKLQHRGANLQSQGLQSHTLTLGHTFHMKKGLHKRLKKRAQ